MGDPGRRALLGGGALLAVGAGLVAPTTPFTVGADAVTAALLAAVGLLAVVRGGQGEGGLLASAGHRLPRPAGRRWPWAVAAGAVLLLELVALFSPPRADHPTFSSLSGPALAWPPSRALAFLVWGLAGWWLATR
jgi:hypothetical protein